MLKLTWPRVGAWRMHRHHLVRRAPAGSMLRVASRICGLHAQVMSCAELSVWARVENLDRRAVQRALWQDRTLIKTWAMRGTLHLLPSRELALWHAALSTNPRYLRPVLWKKYYGITLDELDRLTETVGTALDGRVMTREELVKEVARLAGSDAFSSKIAQSSWGTILKPAAFAGRLCFGPSIGQRVQFTRPDTWLAGSGHGLGPRIDPEVATADVTRRFLRAYGPATYRDLARWWGGGGISTARQWIAALGDEVCRVDLDGDQAWMLARDAREARDVSADGSVSLLPGFDQYVIGASCHAMHLLPGVLRSRIYRPQGWISPVLLVNGRMEGIWQHRLKGSRVDVMIEPFGKPPGWLRRAAGLEAERLGGFFGGKVNLTWKT